MAALVGSAEFIELLQRRDLRAETPIPAELREVSDCSEIRLQSVFIEAKPCPCLVLVHKVELDTSRVLSSSPRIVKFTSGQHSPVRSENLKLGTAHHYRGYAGEGPGIRDESEERYVESLQSCLEEWNPEALNSPWWRSVTDGSVTYQGDGGWFYCASLPPRTDGERAALEQDFNANCMTDLGDPAEFARELGSAFAHMRPAPQVTLDGLLHRLQKQVLRTQSDFERIVHVCHGHVVYTDDHERFVKRIPFQHRASAFPFVKHPDYAYQREYRFTVSTIGKPAQDELHLPVTDQLRELAAIVT